MAASFGLCILCSGVKKVLVTQKAFKETASADQPETIRARVVHACTNTSPGYGISFFF